MIYPITEAEFGSALASFEHTAFRLEFQDAYAEPCEADLLAAFLRGEPYPATEVPELRDWYEQVSRQVLEGKRVERVRVQRDPPTDYQRFERWLDQWNVQAGEVMRYMTWQKAHQIGLLREQRFLPSDWWLLDSGRLIVMEFNEDGHRIGNELITEPAAVVQACKWRDLAVHHAVQAHLSDVAA